MKQLPFGKTGTQVSQICLGAMLMGTALNQEDSFAVLDHFLEVGGNFIDTANCYAWWMGPQYTGDESETMLGQWMKTRGNRDKVFWQLRLGHRSRTSRIPGSGKNFEAL